jgi:hypothetical protein
MLKPLSIYKRATVLAHSECVETKRKCFRPAGETGASHPLRAFSATSMSESQHRCASGEF